MKIGADRKPARKPEGLSDIAVEETLQAIEELDKGKSKTFDGIHELFNDLTTQGQIPAFRPGVGH